MAAMSAWHASSIGAFYISTLKGPFGCEGKKTMAYAPAMQLGWRLPDVVIYPTGGGTGIVGMWKAFAEMETLGWIGAARPRVISVQAEGCAPIVRAYEEQAERARPWEQARTYASGIRVPAAVGDYLILQAVRASGGRALAVSEKEVAQRAQLITTLEGIFAAPAGGATLAALARLRATGAVRAEERVVLFNTGTGLKYPLAPRDELASA